MFKKIHNIHIPGYLYIYNLVAFNIWMKYTLLFFHRFKSFQKDFCVKIERVDFLFYPYSEYSKPYSV